MSFPTFHGEPYLFVYEQFHCNRYTFRTYFELISGKLMIVDHCCSKHHTLWITHRSNLVNNFHSAREAGLYACDGHTHRNLVFLIVLNSLKLHGLIPGLSPDSRGWFGHTHNHTHLCSVYSDPRVVRKSLCRQDKKIGGEGKRR